MRTKERLLTLLCLKDYVKFLEFTRPRQRHSTRNRTTWWIDLTKPSYLISRLCYQEMNKIRIWNHPYSCFPITMLSTRELVMFHLRCCLVVNCVFLAIPCLINHRVSLHRQKSTFEISMHYLRNIHYFAQTRIQFATERTKKRYDINVIEHELHQDDYGRYGTSFHVKDSPRS